MDVPEELLREAYAYRETMLPKADAMHGSAPLWYGWAIFDAYVAGSLAQKERDAKIAETQADKPFAKHGKWHGTLRASIAAAIRQS